MIFWILFLLFCLLIIETLLLIFALYYLVLNFAMFLLFPPYVPSSLSKVKAMLELAQPKRGEVLYDLGSGDGRVLIEVAKEYGVRAIGIEINPILVLISKRKVKKAGLEKTVKIHWGNFFNQNLSDANIIVVYLSKSANRKLEEKFLRELKPGARIVSEAFTFDKIPLVKVHPKYQDLKLYQI